MQSNCIRGLDPAAPALPLSYPAAFSREIADRIGRFYTLGIPEDTSAMRQGVFDLAQFLAQSRLVLDDERKLLTDALDRFSEGLLFFYFSSVDQNSHMLWGQHDDELLKIYRAVDAAIGEVLRRKPAAEVMVMSDHGFTSFDRAIDLNYWLGKNGLAAKAHALGLNALYVNAAAAERQAIIERLRTGLLALRDPANGRAPIETVVEIHVSGANARYAPDLIVGYAPGYRVSWQSANGDTGEATFADNNDAWIADHCINAADVPGVLFTTRKIAPADPRIKDLPVSLLHLFGLEPEPGMNGHSIYR
jgi:predicted AlkP superfamily phosphohydrolase/phosphomutase